MNYTLVMLIHLIYFVLINFMPLTGAYFLGKRIAPDSLSLKFALTLFFFLLQAAANFSILGVFGLLSAINSIIAGLVSGVLFYYAAVKLLPVPEAVVPEKKTFSRMDLLLLLGIVCISGLTILKSTFIMGTDPYLYHLYYPAMWILHGRIHAVTLIGLPHEYFPVCGEMLFGWLMISGNDLFAPLVQPLSFIMSLAAVAGLWHSYRIPVKFIYGGIFLLSAGGIIIENACLCYTDVLTGSFFTAGICFLILALDGKIPERGKRFFLAAAAGISLGMSAAVKYSGLVLAPPVTLLLLICFFIRRPESRRYTWVTAGSAIFAAGVYYLPNFIKTGNPFYPVKIPFLFDNGFDFERDTIPLKNMWSYFVNDNPWDMNIFTAGLYILLLIGCIIIVFRKKDDVNREMIRLIAVLAGILLAAEILMLAIYPSMTQARQIIPFLMALGILFPPVLYLLTGKFISGKMSTVLFTAAVLIAGCVSACNMGWVRLQYYYIGSVIVCAAVILPGKSCVREWVFRGVSFIFVATWLLCSYIRYEGAVDCMGMVGGKAVTDIVSHIREEGVQKDRQTIASVGCWFNYMLMLDLPGNEVVYVPVNEQNTSHPHEVDSPADLRKNPVAYPVWRARLAEKGCTYLVIDLKSHQDFPANRDQEYRWAQEHPEDFTLLYEYEHISFYKINWSR